MTGVLLVGGASVRFGSPKALARLDGETLAESAWRTLAEACDERLAVGKTQDELALSFPVVDDGSDERAPIAGVVAGLRARPARGLPLPPRRLPARLGRRLATPRRRSAGASADRPLPGAYPRSLLPELERRLEHGDYSLRDLEASIVELDPGELANINTKADLRRVQLL